MSGLLARLRDREAGLTMVELLVAATMSVILVGAASSMLISAVRNQPQLNERSQKVSDARWVQERITRELRNGLRIDEATPTRVSFVGQVRSAECGASAKLGGDEPSRHCQVTYDCSSGSHCTRAEGEKDVVGAGVPRTLIDGLSTGNVFNYFPDAEDPTYVGVVLRFPNPTGSGALTVSDGASLRTQVILSGG